MSHDFRRFPRLDGDDGKEPVIPQNAPLIEFYDRSLFLGQLISVLTRRNEQRGLLIGDITKGGGQMFHSARKASTGFMVMVSVCFLFGMFSLSHADAKNADLISMLNSENRGWRYSSAQLLGERRVVEAVEPLIERFQLEKDHSVRIVVAQALHKIGDARAIPALKKVAKTDRNGTVRHMAAVLATDMEKYAYAR